METLLGFSLDRLRQLCEREGFPKYTAKQLCDWMYRKRVGDFEKMTNLSLATRQRLKEVAEVGMDEPAGCQASTDGTKKYLFDAGGGQYIEAVYIPTDDRATLCVSCQKGCRMGCRFCVTGSQGFHGNLSSAKILNQILSIPESEQLSNIVFMGMGEPMDNYEAIKETIDVLCSEWGMGWSPRRLTVSSVGILPMLERLIEETQCHVAVSLHNPFGPERGEIMPMEKAYPIKDVVQMLKRYDWSGQRRISFEYTMFGGLNDSRRHADGIVKLLRGLPCRVNLIKFHTSPDTPFRSVSVSEMERFRDYLSDKGLTCTIRASRGEDIMAACGLLAGKVGKNL